jgi:hypothetical protein
VINRLPDNCSFLYSDLLQKSMDSQFMTLSGGSFVSKNVNGGKYWYYQSRVTGSVQQAYLGADSEVLRAKIQLAKNENENLRAISLERKRLVAMLGVAGASIEKGRPAKILAGMADAGLFSAGGVLVGSFAYSCYGNMLGVALDKKLMRTEDMDFSLARSMVVGFKREILSDLLHVDATFKRPNQILPASAPFDFVSADGFKVEFLTSKIAAGDKTPVFVEQFGLHAQPLEFMDYLLEDTQMSVVLYGAGIPVSVPSPARFALHKLAVSQCRPIGMQAKITKDIDQASSILETLAEDNPGAIVLAAEALFARDDHLIQLVQNGMGRLNKGLQVVLAEIVCFPVTRWDTDLGRVVKTFVVNSGIHSGEILNISHGVVTQKTGCEDANVVFHSINRLSQAVRIGDVVDIRYGRDMVGVVK